MSQEMLKWLQCVFTPNDVKYLFIDDALNYSGIKIWRQVWKLFGVVTKAHFYDNFENYWGFLGWNSEEYFTKVA